jgi:hypothetical protein
MHATVGDAIVIDGRDVGRQRRRGEVLEIRGDKDHEHYLVRWEDGHESILFPGTDAHVEPHKH